MNVQELASAIRNDISNGLKGVTNISYSLEQIVDDIYLERNKVIKEYMIKGLIPMEELANSIDCIDLDKKSLEGCAIEGKVVRHFEIPRLSNSIANPIIYLGTSDRSTPYKVYMDYTYLYHSFNSIIGKKPYVWIKTTLNSNAMYDGYVINCPLLKHIAITAVFEDVRELLKFDCVKHINLPDFIKADIKTRLVERYVRYYRQLNQPIIQNNTQVSTS